MSFRIIFILYKQLNVVSGSHLGDKETFYRGNESLVMTNYI